MLKKSYLKGGKRCRVTFIVPPKAGEGVSRACLVGVFNGWDQEAAPMKKRPDGSFELTVTLDAGQEYRFRYLLDGSRWENDWNADKYLPSAFPDAEDSVVIV